MRRFTAGDIVEDKDGVEWTVNTHDPESIYNVYVCNQERCKWFPDTELDHVMPDELVENEIKQILYEGN